VKRIKTSVFTPDWDLSYAALEYGYNFGRDGQTEIDGNAAIDALSQKSIRMASVDIVKLVQLFFPKKKKSPRELVNLKKLATQTLLDRYSHQYIADTFEIPNEKVNDFAYFVEDKGLLLSLLKPEKEIELLEHLFKLSEQYKQQIETKD